MSFFYRIARSVGRIVGPNSVAARAVRPVTERVLQKITGRRGLAWDINGVPCRIDPRFRAQLARNYDSHLATVLRDKVRPGQKCLDVGANIGAWVIQFAAMVGPAGRVVAFEPNPGAREVLENHIRMNDLDEVACVVPMAVSATPGEVTFFAAGADGMSRIGEPNPALTGAKSITVPVVTIDSWCRENDVEPDWMLIDVEGYEGHVLAGAAEIIRARGTRLGIVVEMHPSIWEASGTSHDEVAARVASVGRRAVPLSGQADVFGEYGHVLLEPLTQSANEEPSEVRS